MNRIVFSDHSSDTARSWSSTRGLNVLRMQLERWNDEMEAEAMQFAYELEWNRMCGGAGAAATTVFCAECTVESALLLILFCSVVFYSITAHLRKEVTSQDLRLRCVLTGATVLPGGHSGSSIVLEETRTAPKSKDRQRHIVVLLFAPLLRLTSIDACVSITVPLLYAINCSR